MLKYWPYRFSTGNICRVFKLAEPVLHQQTCPVCGRKLVNTYFRDGKWKCRRCWEEDVHGN